MMQTRRRWLGLGVVSLGVALIIVDSTIVNVAIPSIIDDISITSTQAQWIQEIYTLVFAALLLVFMTALSINLARNHPVDCGCFSTAGGARSTVERVADMRWALLRDLGLLLLAAQVLAAGTARRRE